MLGVDVEVVVDATVVEVTGGDVVDGALDVVELGELGFPIGTTSFSRTLRNEAASSLTRC